MNAEEVLIPISKHGA